MQMMYPPGKFPNLNTVYSKWKWIYHRCNLPVDTNEWQERSILFVMFNLSRKGSYLANIWNISNSPDCNHGNPHYLLGYFSLLSQRKTAWYNGMKPGCDTHTQKRSSRGSLALFSLKWQTRSLHVQSWYDWLLCYRAECVSWFWGRSQPHTSQITANRYMSESKSIWGFSLQFNLLAQAGSQ